MDALYKWWFIFWSCVIGFLATFHFGLFHKLAHVDATYLGFTTIGLFVVMTCYIGVLTRRIIKGTHTLDEVEVATKPCWFSSEAMNAFGMMGTVAGFLIMLSAFDMNIDVANVDAARKLIAQTAIGLSTAAATTLVGLICSTITKLQLVNLEKAIDEARLS